MQTELTNRHSSIITEKTPPPGIDSLLWNGLKYCIERPIPTPKLDTTLHRLTNDIRLKYFWRHHPTDDQDYNPKLYIKSDWNPPQASAAIETALKNFHTDILFQTTANKRQQIRQHNLLPSSRLLLRSLKTNQDFIILPTDKNLGPAILERDVYKRRCLQDHLLDTSTYTQLSHEDADGLLYLAQKKMEYIIKKYEPNLPTTELTYFQRCAHETRRIPQFYCTPKVHKKPHWKTRPIVSCVNSRMGDLSKWVDVQLQKVLHLCPTHLKDSRTFLQRLHNLENLPPSAVILTADAVSMYTNINTNHALETFWRFAPPYSHSPPP